MTRSSATTPTTVHVDASKLTPIGRRPPMGEYLKEVWRLRYFLVAQAKYRALTTGRGTYLGRAWLLLEPFLRIGMYFVIFGLILKVSRGMENFLAFLAIGVIMFVPLTSALNTGSAILSRHRAIIKGFSFPRASLVFSDSIRSAYDSIPDAIALLVFIWIVPPHAPPTWTWLLLPPFLILAQVFITGLMFLSAWLSSLFPDIKHLWPILTRFWFYGSGVLFPISQFVHDPTALLVLNANPAAVILNIAREILMEGTVPRLSLWIQLVGWALAAVSFGLLLFWSREEEYNSER